MLCARYLVASEHMERSGPVAAAVRAIGYASEEEEEEDEEEGSSIEEEREEEEVGEHEEEELVGEHAYGADGEAVPDYSHPEKNAGVEIGPNGYAIEKKRPTSEQPEHGAAEPLTAPRAHDGYDDHDDEAQVAPAPDAGDDVVKQPQQQQHGKPSLRQQEKAPEGKEPRVPPISSLEHPEAGATAIGHDGGGGEAHAHAHADGDRDGGDGDLEYLDAPPPTGAGAVPSQGADVAATGIATQSDTRGHPYTTTASVVTVSTLGATAVAAGVGVASSYMGGGGETLLAYAKEVGGAVVGSVGGVVYPAAEWVIGMGESIGVPKAAEYVEGVVGNFNLKEVVGQVDYEAYGRGMMGYGREVFVGAKDLLGKVGEAVGERAHGAWAFGEIESRCQTQPDPSE
ncbi:hypothetical protein H0H93_009655, partial [Arthromyces matolae]